MAGKFNLGYQNTLIIRIEENANREMRDTSRRIQCSIQTASQLVTFQPVLNIEDVPVEQDIIRTAILLGTGLGGQPVDPDRALKIGDSLTLVFYFGQGFKDAIIKNCIATDGSQYKIRLTDERGCPLRPKLMRGFQRAANATYASITVFRLAEKSSLQLGCEVDMCRDACPNSTFKCQSEIISIITQRPHIQTYPIRVAIPSYPSTTNLGFLVCRPGYNHPKCPDNLNNSSVYLKVN